MQRCCMICNSIGLTLGEKKTSLCCYKFREIKFAQYFSPQVTPSQVSESKGIGKCKYQPSYNQLQDTSFLEAPLQMLSLPTGLQSSTWKLLLMTSYLLLFLPATPSNTSMCYFMQYWLGNVASFKAAALGVWYFEKKSGCLFRRYISILQTLKAAHSYIRCL